MLEHGCTSHPSLQLAKLMSWKFYNPLILLISNIVFDEFNIKLICRMFKKKSWVYFYTLEPWLSRLNGSWQNSPDNQGSR